MFKLIRSSFLGLMLGSASCLLAQGGHLPCGVDEHEGHLIKEDMLRQRQLISEQELRAFRSRRNTIFIPTTIQLIARADGTGAPSPADAMTMICRLNEDYAPQNVQFYLQPPIRYVNNDALFADAYIASTMQIMRNNRVNNTMNIFVGSNVSRSVAGYYSRQHDFIFMLTGYANRSSATITHEAGHFYTLPHTFVGWENLRVEDLYGSNPVPAVLSNNRAVEFFARSGAQANCSTAADGFCDTPADYYAYRINCPFRGVAVSPDGVAIEPDARNYMSYFGDECMTLFSDEQQDAMARNIIARNWHTRPNPNIPSLGAEPALLQPIADEQVPLADVRFEWEAVAGASGYVVIIERTLFGVPVETLGEFVSNTASLELPAARFTVNRQYRWRVKPFNGRETCRNFGANERFSIAPALVSNLNNLPTGRFEAAIVGYPQGGQIRLWTRQSQEADLRLALYDARGVLQVQQNLGSSNGEQWQDLHLGHLASGFYVLSVESGAERQVLRVIVP